MKPVARATYQVSCGSVSRSVTRRPPARRPAVRPVPASRCRSGGQPATRCTVPAESTRRDGNPSSASQSGAPRPRTTAAVLAVLASTQLAAVTVTVRQTGSAGRPVRGSRTWWYAPAAAAPAADRGARGGQAAAVQPDHRPGTPGAGDVGGPASVSSVSRTGQPPAGTGPAAARSPPTLTSTPAPVAAAIAAAARSTASALAVAPRSSASAGRDAQGAGRAVQLDLLPGAGSGRPGRDGRAVGGQGRVVGVVAGGDQRAAERRVDVAAGLRGRDQRDLDRLGEQGETSDGTAGGGVDRGQLGVVPEPAAGQVDRVPAPPAAPGPRCRARPGGRRAAAPRTCPTPRTGSARPGLGGLPPSGAGRLRQDPDGATGAGARRRTCRPCSRPSGRGRLRRRRGGSGSGGGGTSLVGGAGGGFGACSSLSASAPAGAARRCVVAAGAAVVESSTRRSAAAGAAGARVRGRLRRGPPVAGRRRRLPDGRAPA